MKPIESQETFGELKVTQGPAPLERHEDENGKPHWLTPAEYAVAKVSQYLTKIMRPFRGDQ